MTEKSLLEQRLSSVAELIDWPTPSPGLAARVTARVEADAGPRRPWSLPRLAVALAVVLALVGVVALSPVARQAVADLFDAAGVRIGLTSEPAPAVGAGLNLGEPATLGDAAGEVGVTVRAPAGPEPGPPAAVYLHNGRLSMVWAATPALPAADDTGVGLLFTQSRAVPGTDIATKTLSPQAEVHELTAEGAPALWIEGAPHTFTLLDPQGGLVEETTRLAANVLLWEIDGVNHRLETTGDLQNALAFVASLEPVP